MLILPNFSIKLFCQLKDLFAHIQTRDLVDSIKMEQKKLR